MGAAGTVLSDEREDAGLTLFALFQRHQRQLCNVIPDFAERISEAADSDSRFNELIAQNEVVLAVLLSMIGNRRMQNCFNEKFFNVQELEYSVSDPGTAAGVHVIVTALTAQIGDLAAVEMEINEIISTCDTEYGLNCSCKEDLGDINFLAPYFRDNAKELLYLDVSNSPLNVDGIKESSLQASRVQSLLCGGTGLAANIAEATSSLPISLMALDLSCTSDLILWMGMFAGCPQLVQLILEDCGITYTMADNINNEVGAKGSIFFGLSCLRYLSLKDNCIESPDGLEGVISLSNKSISGPLCSLMRVDILGNPFCDESKKLRAACDLLTNKVPSLVRIDNKVIASNIDGAKLNGFIATSVHNQGGIAVTDDMEKEFRAAMKGEKDAAVVS